MHASFLTMICTTNNTSTLLYATTQNHTSFVSKNLKDFDEEKKSKCNDNATLMYNYIIEKCAPVHPSIFTDSVIGNWRSWVDEQHTMWTNTPQFLFRLSPFVWPSPKETRRQDNQLPLIQPSEQPEPAPGIEIITHDSSMHGKFSKTELVENRRKQRLNQDARLT